MDKLALYVNSRLRGLIKTRRSYLRPMPDGLMDFEENISRRIEYNQERDNRDYISAPDS